MKNAESPGIIRYAGLFALILLVLACIPPATGAPLTNNRHIFVNVANDAGVKYDIDGPKYGGPSNMYYIKADGGGLNELHITNNIDEPYGQVTETTDQSGVFYLSNTGGRGFDNDIILLIAVKEPVPDDFSVQIKSSGYTWTPAASGPSTPPPPTDYEYVASGVSETFTKSDLIYGPQNWKPGPGALGDMTLPVFNGEDMADPANQFRLMFIDLKAGNMFPSKFPDATLTDNGDVRVEYSFSNLHTFAAFNGYGWCSAANQDQGISWTNPTRDFSANGPHQSGQSGYSVIGTTSSGSSGAGAVGFFQPGSAVQVSEVNGYKGKEISTIRSGTVNGSVLFFSDPSAGPVPANTRTRNFNLSVAVPPDANITLSRLYLYISGSQYISGGKGVVPTFYSMLDNVLIEPEKMYVDADGDSDGKVVATVAYGGRDLLDRNGTYTFSIRNMDPDTSLFTIDRLLLVTAYEQENATATSFWITEGCDSILADPEKGRFPSDSETVYSFSGSVNMSTSGDAYLYLVSSGLDSNATTEHTLLFNKGTWHNTFDNERAIGDEYSAGSEHVATDNTTFIIKHVPVGAWINETKNAATIQSAIRTHDADYLVNRNAFLIVEHPGEANSSEPDSSFTAPDLTVSGTIQPGSASDDLTAFGRMNESRNESGCCEITLDSDPEGAEIFIDETFIGKTSPYMLEVGKGETHTARFELDGYSPSVSEFTAVNSTTIRPSLYSPVHSTKNRLAVEPEDPDGIRYGGLYVYSRPRSAAISINGIRTGKTTPAVFMGLEPGLYTINLGKLQDITYQENDLFDFRDQNVRVLPDEITMVDISGIGDHIFSKIIIDSRRYRGMPFTVNGYVDNKTIPARIETALFNSFITVHDNESYVSYRVPVPYVWDDERYLLFEPRDHQNLSIAVTSDPRGGQIFVDGFRTGYSTPYIVGNLSDGLHRILVTKNGYLPKQGLIELQRSTGPLSPVPVDFDLEEYPSGFLYVNSTPGGSRIAIDGMYTGEITPALFKTLSTGTHVVKVAGGNSTKLYDVTVNSIYMTNVTADFTPEEE